MMENQVVVRSEDPQPTNPLRLVTAYAWHCFRNYGDEWLRVVATDEGARHDAEFPAWPSRDSTVLPSQRRSRGLKSHPLPLSLSCYSAERIVTSRRYGSRGVGFKQIAGRGRRRGSR